MKKLVIAALAIGAMAACTKSNIQYEQPEEISFQPVAKKATKAVNGAIAGNAYPADESFNVWAWWGDSAPSDSPTYSNYGDLYINAGEFVAKDNYNWGGSTAYYWPTSGSLVFAGYSPARANATKFEYDLANQTFKVEGYTQSSDIAQTIDLMWFDAGESYLEKTIVVETPKQGVPVVFNHALSWLEFRFNLAALAPQNWKIRKVYLKGIETKADFTSKDATSKPSWTYHDAAVEELVINSVEKELTVHSPSFDNLSDVAKKGVVVIPQSCAPADAELVIEYGLLTPATAEADVKKYIPQTVTLPLTYTENGDSNVKNEWKPGYHYIYTITFGANEILISPSVTEWAVENEDINVE